MTTFLGGNQKEIAYSICGQKILPTEVDVTSPQQKKRKRGKYRHENIYILS